MGDGGVIRSPETLKLASRDNFDVSVPPYVPFCPLRARFCGCIFIDSDFRCIVCPEHPQRAPFRYILLNGCRSNFFEAISAQLMLAEGIHLRLMCDFV